SSDLSPPAATGARRLPDSARAPRSPPVPCRGGPAPPGRPRSDRRPPSGDSRLRRGRARAVPRVCSCPAKASLLFECFGGGQGGAVDLTPRCSRGERQPPAVLELGRDCERPSLEPGPLDPHRTERGGDLGRLAFRLEAARSVITATER